MYSRRFVTIAFVIMGVSAVLATASALERAHALERQATDIVSDMLTSIRLLGRLQHELDEQRRLVDEHILSSSPAEMEKLEAGITSLELELDATMRAYDRWTTLPGERAAWNRARADLAALREPLERALALSRREEDAEARLAMRTVSERFLAISGAIAQLIAINDEGATRNVAEIARLRRQLIVTLLGIGLAAVAATFLLGRWATREVARREADLIRYSTDLEARNRDLDAFAGRVAHDVRGPLQAITLAAAHLARTAIDPVSARFTEQLRRGATRIASLTDDLLALAAVESKVTGRCDPADVATAVKEELAPRIDAQQGALRISVAHADVACSAGLLRQVLENLTENAVKYRRPDVPPLVAIEGTPSNGVYALRVSDNGLGMTAEETANVFTPFYRSPKVQQVPGTGLGLSIVRRVAEAAGGSASVESRAGVGTTFVVTLRLARQ
jgi:signal transduction histidine kinase